MAGDGIARVYPNGSADVNHFHAAGGTGTLFTALLDAGLMHPDANTCFGDGFGDFCQEPTLVDNHIEWRPAAAESLDPEILKHPQLPSLLMVALSFSKVIWAAVS